MLARGMGYKNAIFDIPVGGAKVTIKKRARAKDNNTILSELLKAIHPLISTRKLFLGPDMGVTEDEMIHAYEESGLSEYLSTSVLTKKHGNIPLVRAATACGIVSSVESVLQFTRIDRKAPAVAVEGFGKIAAELVCQLDTRGFRVVAISNRNGTLEVADGINIKTILNSKLSLGDEALPRYAEKTSESVWKPNQSIYSTDCEILIPGAGIFSLDSASAQEVKAKLVAPFGNLALTYDAESILFSRGIVALPYFVTSGGGVISGACCRLGLSSEETLSMVASRIGTVIRKVLDNSLKLKLTPTSVAEILSEKKIGRMERLGDAAALFGWWKSILRYPPRKLLSRAVW